MSEECEVCEGTGWIDGYCLTCNGSGEGMADGTKCHACKGSGSCKDGCLTCEGTGKVIEDDE